MRIFTVLLLPMLFINSVHAQILNNMTFDEATIEVVSVSANKPQLGKINLSYLPKVEPGFDIVLKVTYKNTPRLLIDKTSLLLQLKDSRGSDLIRNGEMVHENIVSHLRATGEYRLGLTMMPHNGTYIKQSNCNENNCIMVIHTDAIPDKASTFVTAKAELKLQVAQAANSQLIPTTLSSETQTVKIEDEEVTFSKLGYGGQEEDYVFEYYQFKSDLAILDVQAIDTADGVYPKNTVKLASDTYYGLPGSGFPVKGIFVTYAKVQNIVIPLHFSVTMSGGMVPLN